MIKSDTTIIADSYEWVERDGLLFIRLNNKSRDVCIIDSENKFIIEEFYSLNIHRNRACVYRTIQTNYSILHEQLAIHRIVMGNSKQYSRGATMMVDHINRNFLDNRVKNLRFASASQNSTNAAATSRSKTGLRGVIETKRNLKKKFLAYAKEKGASKNKNLGYFYTKEEAARAYDDYQWNQHGEFAFLNFPERYKSPEKIIHIPEF